MDAVYRRLEKYVDPLMVSPAIPLAIYFSLSTMLPLLPTYFGVRHPAYWVFAYLGICVAWQLREARPKMHVIDLVLLLFLAVMFFSWASTGYTGGMRAVTLILSSLVIPWGTIKVFRQSDAETFLRWVAFFGGSICLIYLFAIPIFHRAANWERVPFLETVAYGVIGPPVGLLAVLSAIYLMRESWKLAWLALAASVMVIVHMGARGMFVSMCLTLLIACLFIDADRRRKAAIWVVVLFSAGIASTVIPDARLHHFLRLAMDIPALDRSVDDTIAIRLRLYRRAFELFLAMPASGVGAGRFGLHTPVNEELTTPHSTMFQVLAELGLAGALPFVVLNLMLLWLAFKARTRALASIVASAWIYFAVFDQISANYLSSLRYYLFSALLIAVSLNAGSEGAVLPHRINGVAGKRP